MSSSSLSANSADIAVRVDNLRKCYEIYDSPRARLKQFLMPRLQGLARKAPKQYFREFWALTGVSFEIKKGEAVGVIGSNGSGKSTLLQILCGILSPTSGSVEINGRVAAILELGSGFNPESSGRENIYMNGALLGLTKAEIDARFNDIVAFADIGEFIEQPVKIYYSGLYVRLAFAVIAHVDADILVIDEALSVGDAFFVQKCLRFLRKFMETGTVIFVSHDTAAVVNLCKKAILLHKGGIAAIGAPKDVTERYLEKLYVAQQGESIDQRDETVGRSEPLTEPLRDMRLDFINHTKYRNDIELFSFSHDAQSFGLGGAKIADVRLLDKAGSPLAWIVGGEPVRLLVTCRARQAIASPIVGFMVKDRLGQVIFGDNTFLAYARRPLNISSGACFHAVFDFAMPIMPSGDYIISVAVAEGTQVEHVQHQWIHEALAFKVHASSVCHGLIGVPMGNIELRQL
jgi:lipopolysaccharide transport system ATP-binding protein